MVLPPLHIPCAYHSSYRAAQLSGLCLLSIYPLLNLVICSSPNADSRKGVEQAKNIQEPQHNANHHNCVQDRLEAACHGNEPIYKPQQKSNND